MKAAVVTRFGESPHYADHLLPDVPDGTVVDVVAAGLHPRVLSQADGSHYTTTGELPLVPGIDGVGRTPDGELVYFALPDTTLGSMAEQTVIDRRRSITLPAGADPVLVAAAMNPAMSSWVALRRRIRFEPGQSILVLGATGNAGRTAVQIAKLLGAGRVVAAGRDTAKLEALTTLGADELVALPGTSDGPRAVSDLARAARDVDVVIDYLWGAPTAAALTALVSARLGSDQPLSWVQIGSVAGPTADIPSAALRAIPLQLVGSGQGSVGGREFLAELPALVDVISRGDLAIDPRAVPLRDVESAWAEARTSARRLVLTPN